MFCHNSRVQQLGQWYHCAKQFPSLQCTAIVHRLSSPLRVPWIIPRQPSFAVWLRFSPCQMSLFKFISTQRRRQPSTLEMLVELFAYPSTPPLFSSLFGLVLGWSFFLIPCRPCHTKRSSSSSPISTCGFQCSWRGIVLLHHLEVSTQLSFSSAFSSRSDIAFAMNISLCELLCPFNAKKWSPLHFAVINCCCIGNLSKSIWNWITMWRGQFWVNWGLGVDNSCSATVHVRYVEFP